MEAIEIVHALSGFENRGAGTDAERRAAAWLAARLSHGRPDAVVETFWCRPNWALAHALHAALAVTGSLVSLASAPAGVAILGVTLASVLADSLAGTSLARCLTRARASQNVVSSTVADAAEPGRVRLVVTANYDAGRTGLVYQDWLRRPAAILRHGLRAVTPGWLGWLCVAILWLLAIAVIRLHGHTSHDIGALQLPPTIALLLAFALLLELAVSGWSPAAGDNASGVAVAVAVAHAIADAPPRHLDVEFLLTGAADGDQLGLRRYLRRHRGQRKPADTVVLGIAPCADGRPSWWLGDGPLVPFRYGRRLRELAARVAADEPYLEARPHRGRGTTPALPARVAGIPAVTIGCVDQHGLAPRSHQRGDSADAADADAIDRALQFALLMVDAIDSAVGELAAQRTATPA